MNAEFKRKLEAAKSEIASKGSGEGPDDDISNVYKCADWENDICQCSGTVVYGEKFDRDTNSGRTLSYKEMMKYPHMEKQTGGAPQFVCNYISMKKNPNFDDIFYAVKSEK